MGFGLNIMRKLTKKPKVKKALKKLKQKNNAKTANTTKPKSKPFKVAPKSKSYTSMSRGGSVVTANGLLTNKKTTNKNKKLLGE
jgi:hypothetical protein